MPGCQVQPGQASTATIPCSPSPASSAIPAPPRPCIQPHVPAAQSLLIPPILWRHPNGTVVLLVYIYIPALDSLLKEFTIKVSKSDSRSTGSLDQIHIQICGITFHSWKLKHSTPLLNHHIYKPHTRQQSPLESAASSPELCLPSGLSFSTQLAGQAITKWPTHAQSCRLQPPPLRHFDLEPVT